MINWLLGLPVGWLVVVVPALTFLVTGGIYFAVMALAVGKRADAFKGVSPGMLPPLGIVFGLLMAFLAAGVWSDAGQAQVAVNQEASSLRSALILVHSFPGAPEARMRALIRSHIDEAVT